MIFHDFYIGISIILMNLLRLLYDYFKSMQHAMCINLFVHSPLSIELNSLEDPSQLRSLKRIMAFSPTRISSMISSWAWSAILVCFMAF